jgi:hypothetical protein
MATTSQVKSRENKRANSSDYLKHWDNKNGEEAEEGRDMRRDGYKQLVDEQVPDYRLLPSDNINTHQLLRQLYRLRSQRLGPILPFLPL